MPATRDTLRDELGKLRPQVAYARRLGPWLRAPLTLNTARTMVSTALERRETELVHTFRHGIYAEPDIPYRALLRHAGVELGDVEHAIRDRGVEGALAQLYDAGVRVTLDEMKGRVPITRPGSSCR